MNENQLKDYLKANLRINLSAGRDYNDGWNIIKIELILDGEVIDKVCEMIPND